jgi:hypothetical protein
MPVPDQTIPVPSPNEIFVDRYRRITPKWYPWMRRFFESLKTTITTVNTVEEAVTTLGTNVTEVVQTVDNLTGFYGVQVNVNGRVTAAIQLDGSPARSSFAVLADRFIVVHPSVDGTEIQAFIVGTVNGIPTVGINGNLVVDQTVTSAKVATGAITADKIEAGSITTAKIFAGAVGAAQLASSAVTTAKIATGAVTNGQLGLGAVAQGNVQDAAIIASKIAAGAVVADKIAANAVTAAKIEAGAITADKIVAGAVTADKMNVTSLDAVAGTLGSVTTGRIQSPDGRLDINALAGTPYIRITA